MLTDNEICEITQSLIDMAKRCIESHQTVIAMVLFSPKDKSRKAEILGLPNLSPATRPIIKAVIAAKAIELDAEMVTFISDTWGINIPKMAAYYKLTGTQEQIDQRCARIREVDWKGSLENAPKEIREEGLTIASKGPEIPNFMQRLVYTRNNDGTVTFGEIETMETGMKVQINLIPTWWENPERYTAMFTLARTLGAFETVDIDGNIDGHIDASC